MAYYEEQKDDDQQQQQGGITLGKPTADISAGTGGPGNASATTPGANAPGTPDKPGNFVGITQYLNANKNQAAKLGDQTAGVINQSADQARQGVNNLNQDFNKQVGSNLLVDQDAINRLNSAGAENLSAQDKQNLKTASTAQYTGPKNLTDDSLYSDTSKSLDKARQNIDSASTEQGRMGLVKNINNGYRNQGIDTFDNALLQGGTGREKVEQAAKQNADLKQDVLGQQSLTAQQHAADVANSYKTAQQQASGAIQGATQNFQTGINQKLQDAISKALGQNQRVTEDINDLSLNDETLQMLGLQPGTRTYGLNLGDYLTQADANSLNTGNVASREDYARAAALAELAGISPDQGILNPTNIAQAGTGVPGASFDKGKLKTDLENKAVTEYTNNKDFMPSSNINAGSAWDKILASSKSKKSLPEELAKINYDSLSPKELEAVIPTLQNYAALPSESDSGISAFAKEMIARADKKLNDWNNSSAITSASGAKASAGAGKSDEADSKKGLLDSGGSTSNKKPATIKGK